MSPSAFWSGFMTALYQFYAGIINQVFIPLMDSIMNNLFLLIIFSFMVLGFVIKVFRNV